MFLVLTSFLSLIGSIEPEPEKLPIPMPKCVLRLKKNFLGLQKYEDLFILPNEN